MSATLVFRIAPKDYYLANNPIILKVRSSVQQLISYIVRVDGIDVYNGNLLPTGSGTQFDADISISEIIKPFLRVHELFDSGSVVRRVLNSRTDFEVEIVQGVLNLTHSGFVFRGGVSKQLIRTLNSLNTDIFNEKLISHTKQFLMTTRTLGSNIVIRESELVPFYFIAVDVAYMVVTEYGDIFLLSTPNEDFGEIHAFDIAELRKLCFDLHNRLPSFFAFLVDNNYVFDITIKSDIVSREFITIQFLNSFSAFDKITLSGKAVFKPQILENSFREYDSIVEDYVSRNQRNEIQKIIEIESGYQTIDEYYLMLDMLQSDETYMIDSEKNFIRVLIKSPDFTHELNPTVPGSIKLQIKVQESDSNYSPPSMPSQNLGVAEAIWLNGVTNAYGFLYDNLTLNTD